MLLMDLGVYTIHLDPLRRAGLNQNHQLKTGFLHSINKPGQTCPFTLFFGSEVWDFSRGGEDKFVENVTCFMIFLAHFFAQNL